MRGSLVEDNHDNGVYVGGSDVTVEASVVRTTMPNAAEQTSGTGISIQLLCVATPMGTVCYPTARTRAVVRGSVVEENHGAGLLVSGADAAVEGSVIRATMPNTADQALGRGMGIQPTCIATATGVVCDPSARASAIVRGSLVEENHEVGVYIGSSDVTVEATVVRASSPRASDGLFGDGVVVISAAGPANATLSAVRIEGSVRAQSASDPSRR